MAQLSGADFYAKWVPLLADNVFQDIDGQRLDNLLADLRDSFAPATLATAPTVALYDPARVYAVGELARHTPAGQAEVFGYALQAGLLPAPTGVTTAAWHAIPPPVAALVLAQPLTLAQAPGVDVVAGRRYGISGPWNGATSDALVYLDGLAGAFRRRGTLLRPDGSQQEVEADVPAGTYEPVGTSAVNTYLEISSVNGLRVRELPVPAAFTILEEVLDQNATAIRYQLDKHTRTGTRHYGTPALTLAQVNAELATLTDADRAAGVKLYVRTGATSAVDDALVALLVQCAVNLTLAPAKLLDFPTPPASQGIMQNAYFTQPFTGDELTGWQVYVGWTWDSGRSLALCDHGYYLYQKPSFVISARYRVLVTVEDHPDGRPMSGELYLEFANTYSSPLLLATAPGTYSFDFTASLSGGERIHLVGGSRPGLGGLPLVCAISHFDIIRI